MEIVLFIVLLFAVPAALLYAVEKLEAYLRRIFPAIAKWLLGGLAPLHSLAAIAFAGGCWLSWTNRALWEPWQLAVLPILSAGVVYAGLAVTAIVMSPPDALALGWHAVHVVYRKIVHRGGTR